MTTNYSGYKDEKNITKLEERLSDVLKQIEQKESELNKIKNDIIIQENLLVINKEKLPQEIKRFGDEISLRDKQIENLKQEFNKKSKEILEFPKISEELTKARSYIEDLKGLEIEKDLKINELNKELEAKNKEIIKLNELIEKLNQNEFKNNNSDEEEENIDNLNKRILELKSNLNELKEENVMLKQEKEKIIEEWNITKNVLEREKENNNNNENLSNTLKKLTKENEEEKVNSANLMKEKEELENKLSSMKNALQEIKIKFEQELLRKEKNGNELIKKIKSLEEECKNNNKTITKMNKEKLELEEIILKQEERVNELANKFLSLEKMLKDKNKELKENENHIMQLVGIIEEQKKTINNLNSANSNSMNDDNILENELVLLKNNVKHLRKDIELKDAKLNAAQLKNNSLREELKRIKLNSNLKDNDNLKSNSNKKIIGNAKQNKINNIDKDILPPINNKEIKHLKKVKTPSNQSHISHHENLQQFDELQRMERNYNNIIENNKSMSPIDDNDNNLEEITSMMNKILEDN